MDTKTRLKNYFLASYPAVAIQTSEEARAVGDIFSAAKEANKGVLTWSATEGMKRLLPDLREYENTADLQPACFVREKNSVYIMRDVAGWPLDRDPVLARAFRDLIAWAPTAASCVVIVGPTFSPHPTVAKMVTVMDYDLPDANDLERILRGIAKSLRKEVNGETAAIVRALSGLSTTEAENALALSNVEVGTFDPSIIYREKVQGVKRTGLLEIIDPDPAGLDGIGGLEEMKKYLIERRDSYGPEAEAYRLDSPSGIMIVGVPGTGKSLTAKAVGTVYAVPTLKLDIGSLFNSLVGESEVRTREALKLAEAMAPCVLWIDEIDKGLAGASGSGSNDSGVTKRVFGTIITWMQERKRPVFLTATANDVTNLPPELLRRWDEIFAVDLPFWKERRDILAIQLLKRRSDISAFSNLRTVIDEMDGFTGAEIEKVVKAAMFTAFADGHREFTPGDLLLAAVRLTPLSEMAKEKITEIRIWAKTRARSASTPEVQSEATPTRTFTAR